MSVKPIQAAVAVPHESSQRITTARDPATPNGITAIGRFLAISAIAGVVAAAAAYLSTLAAVRFCCKLELSLPIHAGSPQRRSVKSTRAC
jgi:hypothetical protein